MLSGIMVGRLWGEVLERPRRFIQVLMASSVHVGPLPSTMPDGGCLNAPLGVSQIVVSVTVTEEAVGAVEVDFWSTSISSSTRRHPWPFQGGQPTVRMLSRVHAWVFP